MTAHSSQIQAIDSENDLVQYSLKKLVFLHLAPGAAILALYLLLVPLARSYGWPPLFALIVAALVGVIPVQLGHLLFLGFKLNCRLTLVGVLGNIRKTPKLQFTYLVPLLFIFAVLILLITTPLDKLLVRSVFAWLPSWYFYSDPAIFASYPRSVLAITFGLRILVDGLAIPFVEELYFRAYLLPRMDRYGRWAPVINHGLFTLYHIWQPQNYPTIFFGIFPMVWMTWLKKDFRLAFLTHAALNLVSGFLAYSLIVGKHPV